MVDLATAANVAEILGIFALLGGGLFAWWQIREARQSRESGSALMVLREFMRDENFFVAINQLMRLPDDWHEDPVMRDDPDVIRVAERVYLAIEMLGYFVYARSVKLQNVVDLAGGGIVAAWDKIEGYATLARTTRGPHAFEWFEWLAMQLKKTQVSPESAAQTFADWKP